MMIGLWSYCIDWMFVEKSVVAPLKRISVPRFIGDLHFTIATRMWLKKCVTTPIGLEGFVVAATFPTLFFFTAFFAFGLTGVFRLVFGLAFDFVFFAFFFMIFTYYPPRAEPVFPFPFLASSSLMVASTFSTSSAGSLENETFPVPLCDFSKSSRI